jgi:aminoglycoside phosphotransferase (APT) family kinase protein
MTKLNVSDSAPDQLAGGWRQSALAEGPGLPPRALTQLDELSLAAAEAARLGLPDGPLRLRRAWPRSPAHLLLEYEGAGETPVPGQWWAERADATRALGKSTGQIVALPARSGGVVALQPHGADQRLPGLAPLLRRPGARLLVHQPGRRAVVRLSEGAATVFAKLVRPPRAAAMAASGRVAEQLGGGAFVTPRLLTIDEQAGIVYWSALPGAALHALPGGAALEAGAWAAGQALRALHAAPAPPALPEHGPAAERAVLERWIALAAAYNPALGAAATELAVGVGAALAATSGSLGPVHRDFYDKQILVARDGTIGLIDFDTLAQGEPALDLANALVHFELRAMQGLIKGAHAASAQAALYAGYAPGPEVRARLAAYANATRLRLACVYSFRPRWRGCVAALLSRVRAEATRAPG